MKLRVNFVSNSSSSSCIVGHKPEGLASVKLSDDQSQRVRAYLEAHADESEKAALAALDECDEWYLTQFITGYEHNAENVFESRDSMHYMDGEMSGNPYDYDGVVELTGNRYPEGDGVWILRDHSPVHKVVTARQLAALAAKMFNCDSFVVEVKSNIMEVRPYEV